MTGKSKYVLSLHWGFSIGGVGKYATIIDKINDHSDISIANVVIIIPGVHVDKETMSRLKNLEVLELIGRFDLSWIWRLKKIIKEMSPDLVITHGFNGHFVMLVEKYFMRVAVSMACTYHGKYHATTSIRRILGLAYNLFTEFYIRRCVTNVVSVAEYCKEYLIERGVSASKICVIHNGIPNIPVDREKRQELRDQWCVTEDELLLGVASRLDPVKGIEYLINAFILLAKRHTNVKLVVIGVGTLGNVLKNAVNSAGLQDKVIFTGFRDDVDSCLNAIDIFVLPSLAEYHSIALLEAMRAGKVIVSTDVGGNTESVRDEKEALVVPSCDSLAIEAALERLLQNQELMFKLSEAARQRYVDKFTEEKTVDNTRTWLNSLLINST